MQISNNTNTPKFKGIFVKYNSFDEINTVARMLNTTATPDLVTKIAMCQMVNIFTCKKKLAS